MNELFFPFANLSHNNNLLASYLLVSMSVLFLYLIHIWEISLVVSLCVFLISISVFFIFVFNKILVLGFFLIHFHFLHFAIFFLLVIKFQFYGIFLFLSLLRVQTFYFHLLWSFLRETSPLYSKRGKNHTIPNSLCGPYDYQEGVRPQHHYSFVYNLFFFPFFFH